MNNRNKSPQKRTRSSRKIRKKVKAALKEAKGDLDMTLQLLGVNDQIERRVIKEIVGGSQ